jgi:hypothetical protein
MTTHWKDNFENFAMKLWFSTYSVLEVEEKLVEDEPVIRDKEKLSSGTSTYSVLEVGGEDVMRNNWDQGSWQRADIEG